MATPGRRRVETTASTLRLSRDVCVKMLGFLDPLYDLPLLHRVSREWTQLVDDAESTQIRHLALFNRFPRGGAVLDRWAKCVVSLRVGVGPLLFFFAPSVAEWLGKLTKLQQLTANFCVDATRIESNGDLGWMLQSLAPTAPLRACNVEMHVPRDVSDLTRYAPTLEELDLHNECGFTMAGVGCVGKTVFSKLRSLKYRNGNTAVLQRLLPSDLCEFRHRYPVLTTLCVDGRAIGRLAPLARALQTDASLAMRWIGAVAPSSKTSYARL